MTDTNGLPNRNCHVDTSLGCVHSLDQFVLLTCGIVHMVQIWCTNFLIWWFVIHALSERTPHDHHLQWRAQDFKRNFSPTDFHRAMNLLWRAIGRVKTIYQRGVGLLNAISIYIFWDHLNHSWQMDRQLHTLSWQ